MSRTPIAARGNALLKLVAAAGDKGLMLTQAEAHMALKAGEIVVDTTKANGELAPAKLTDAGKAKLASKPKVDFNFELDTGIAPPAKVRASKGPRGSKYNFDKFEVGQSLHIAATAENPKPITSLTSALAQAKRQFAKPEMKDGKPVVEVVEVNTYKLDAKGKREKDAEGKWIVIGKETKERAKTYQERDFVVAVVGSDDPKGAGARLYRIK